MSRRHRNGAFDKRHFTLPIYDQFDTLLGVKLPIHQSEADEMKYVRTVLENHSIPNAFEGLAIVLSKTNHRSVHKEIADFILKCLEKPLDITECMEGESKMRHSFSSDFDSPLFEIKPKVRTSVSMSHFQTLEESDQSSAMSENEMDEPDEDSPFLIELLNNLPSMIPHFTKEEQTNVLSKIPGIFIALAPDPQVMNIKGIPKFVYFKAATQCATAIIKLNSVNVIDKSEIFQLAKLIILASFTCSSNIGDIVRMTKSKSTAFLNYIGECLPFFATLLPIIDKDDNGLILLLQQFFISMIVQTTGDLSILAKNFRELITVINLMPPFVSSSNQIEFSTLSAYVQDILTKLKVNQYQKRNEEFAEAFCKIAPNIPIKTVTNLPIADIVLLLSIAVLEKTRASQGNFIPMFGYFEVDFYPEFSQCLDAIAFPIFMSFQTYISSLSSVVIIRSKILPILSHVFKHYTGRNPRVLSFIDKITSPIVSVHPLAICAHETAKSYLESYVDLKYQKSTRLESLKEIGLQMFAKSVEMVPNAFNAVLHNIIFRENENIFSPQSDFLSVIMDLYPPEQLLTFTQQLSVKQRALGVVKYLSHRQINKIENKDDRLLLLALHFINCSNKKAVKELSDTASPSLLMMIWSQIAMVPEYQSKEFMQALAVKFVKLVNRDRGIFNQKEIEIDFIKYQATVLSFFSEQLNLMTFAEEILFIVSPMIHKEFNSSPAIITALIPLAYFICTAILVPRSNTVMRVSLVHYLLKLVLVIISIYSKPNLYKYLDESDLENLQKLIDQFNLVAKSLNINQDISNILKPPVNRVKIGENACAVLRKLSEIAKTDALIYHKISDLICFLLVNEYSFFSAYFNPTTKSAISSALISKYMVKPRNYFLPAVIPFFWQVYPTSIPSVCEILNVLDQVIPLIPALLEESPNNAKGVPILISKASPGSLHLCDIMPPESSLSLLRPEILENQESSKYVEKCLEQFTVQNALLYIPQFVQALRYDPFDSLREFLLQFCKKSDSFTHFLLWNIASEKCKVSIDEKFQQSLVALEGQILFTMNTDEQQHYDNELQFINNISAISARLLPLPFDERKKALVDELSNLIFTSDLYVPSNPEYKILEIDAAHSIPLKSHSRVPILVRFKARKGKEKPTFINCIFKIEDDVRMDALMIQLIDRIYTIILESGIDCFLLPYRIYATGDNRGVIECIQNAKSRHDLGELTKSSLLKYFIAAYGQPGTPDFERAQYNFIKSMAPYSLICYLFQVKDRHNANIMIDDEGHVIHIDFGFIFEISPGGNMKFEKAPFKLSNEMVELMGGSITAPPFIRFSELFAQCFVAIRSRIDEIEAIAYLMKDAGLTCFKNDSFKKLRERFFLDKPGVDLQESVHSLITSSLGAYTTLAYDAFQSAQNGIFYMK
ncbi:Phosphatidylinositol 3- and 4-kinase family protein [Tritrichomonas foetus]|uniref:Phosphatidylinositol 3- and 4-kinase family protein n=1 Tax=Tritrichomonas foetus TaxID=1144522 RepID=A0A1J4KKL9_9EUKA|nr:Phosphatidylinositol 3- and 4-kinase family protein [Tritrichomonas foetus]|eukprot:OHT10348.1 Phosphatidylinositol 3- and 4-kinase family protein [Tritrichomonas foetus]